MYEMYPDEWTAPEDRRPQTPGLRPRRRARREHVVVPAVLPPAAPRPADPRTPR